MLLAEFELAIPVSERPQTYALERAATGIGPFTFANIRPLLFNCLTTVVTFNPHYSEMLISSTLKHKNQSLIEGKGKGKAIPL
jgi:hypothetical protein